MPYSAENMVRAAKRVPSLILKFVDLFSLLLIFLTPSLIFIRPEILCH